MVRKVRTVELRLTEIPEEMASDLEYFIEDVKELYEHYGWKVVWNSVEGEDKDE